MLQKWIHRYHSLGLLFLGLIYYSTAAAEPVLKDWQTYSSMLNVKSGSFDSRGRIWCATEGGIYCLDPKTDDYHEFRNINAMLGIDVSAVSCDTAEKLVYIGTQSGVLEIASEDFEWTHILDIKNSNFTNPVIYDIKFKNDKVYIAGGFGLTVFDKKRRVFIEDALNLGEFQPNTVVRKILLAANEIWLATDAGVARASLNSSISPRSAWTNYTRANGLPDEKISNIEFFLDEIYVSTPNNLCKLIGNEFAVLNADRVLSMTATPNELYYTVDVKLRTISGKDINLAHPGEIIGHILKNDSIKNEFVFFYRDNGIGLYDNDLKTFLPNTPVSNQFVSLKVDSEGALWACSDGTASGNGFMKYKDSVWQNFTPKNFPDQSDAIKAAYIINVHPDGRAILSTKGHGLLIMSRQGEGYSLANFDESNAPFVGNGFTVVGETAVDNSGAIWMTQYGGSSNGPALLRLGKDNQWYGYTNLMNPTQRNYLYLTIDNYATKWLGSKDGSSGLYYFTDKNTPAIPSDDTGGLLTTSNSGILSNDQTCLALDKNGMLWIGTSSGISVVTYPGNVLTGSNPIIRKEVKDLRNVYINDILVDALNNKWVATPEGVYLLDADGVTQKILTTQNSPLITNNVVCIESDPKTGRIFLGSKLGLNEISTLSVEPIASYDIRCYPQPFSPLKDSELIIEGLASDSELRIITTNGELVRRINTQSRKAVWDGKDESGKTVTSGIYLLLADSITSGSKAIFKIAVQSR